MYQTAMKLTNIFRWGPPKYTQIGIFGMKIYHLATLDSMVRFILWEDIWAVQISSRQYFLLLV
jgi:hypothetical protein